MVAAQAFHHGLVIVVIEMQQLAQLLELTEGLGPVEAHGGHHLGHRLAGDAARLVAARRPDRPHEGDPIGGRPGATAAANAPRVDAGRAAKPGAPWVAREGPA